MSSVRPQHSPDGALWWTGSHWVSAWSPDFQHWFNGTEWIPRPLEPKLPLLTRGDAVVALVWVAVTSMATGFGMQAAANSATPAAEPTWALWTLACLGGTLALLMPISGFVAGRRPGAVPRLAVAAAVMWTSLIVAYALMMVMSSDPSSDNAAGVGIVILAVPTALAVSVLVGFGALVRLAVDRIRR